MDVEVLRSNCRHAIIKRTMFYKAKVFKNNEIFWRYSKKSFKSKVFTVPTIIRQELQINQPGTETEKKTSNMKGKIFTTIDGAAYCFKYICNKYQKRPSIGISYNSIYKYFK